MQVLARVGTAIAVIVLSVGHYYVAPPPVAAQMSMRAAHNAG